MVFKSKSYETTKILWNDNYEEKISDFINKIRVDDEEQYSDDEFDYLEFSCSRKRLI